MTDGKTDTERALFVAEAALEIGRLTVQTVARVLSAVERQAARIDALEEEVARLRLKASSVSEAS